MTAQTFTDEMKAMAAEREVKQRRHVYPRLIESGKITTRFAEAQIAIMEEIAADYRKLAEKERLL